MSSKCAFTACCGAPARFAATRGLASSARRALSSSASARLPDAAPVASSSSSPAPPPPPMPAAAAASPKVDGLVDRIAGLTLLEAADLVQALKSRLNIADVPMAAAAPSGPAGGGAGAAAAPAEAAAPEPVKEKTAFQVVLKAIDAAQKAKAIKEVKAVMTGMNLVEAKKFVESCPQTLKENATKEDAEKLKAALVAVGATVEVS